MSALTASALRAMLDEVIATHGDVPVYYHVSDTVDYGWEVCSSDYEEPAGGARVVTDERDGPHTRKPCEPRFVIGPEL